MQTRRLLLGMGVGLAVMLVPAALFFVRAQNQPPAALTGHVTSEVEGAMEGVVVSAKKAGSTVTVSVVSDAQGRYSFPANRLSAGKYSLKIRAIGYNLVGPATANVAEEQTTTVDLKLRKAKKPGLADEQCRMDDEPARDGGSESFPARLRRLPHARAHRALDP